MAQNVYDDPEFFAGYSRLRRSVLGLDGAPEWLAVRALLPALTGKRVIDLGCGFGWFCRWARANGAAHVTGFDLSEKMLARAGSDTKDSNIVYVKADLESLRLEEGTFDFAFSSLALHYIQDLERLVETIHHSLVPGARFLFTVEHPVFTAPIQPEWIVDGAGRKSWPVNSYTAEGERLRTWLAATVVKRHRTLGTTLNTLIAAGFTITHVQEWSPTTEDVAGLPSLADELERPMIAIIAVDR